MAKQVNKKDVDIIFSSIEKRLNHEHSKIMLAYELIDLIIKDDVDKIRAGIKVNKWPIDSMLCKIQNQKNKNKYEFINENNFNQKEKTLINHAMGVLGDYEGINAVCACVVLNRIGILRELINCGSQVNLILPGGIDAGCIATDKNYVDIFIYLVESGLNPHFSVPITRESRLIKAVKNSNYEISRYLIENKKVKINKYDGLGRTALHYNLEKNPYTEEDEKIGRLLIEYDGDPNIEDLDGIPAHIYVEDNDVKKVLLEKHKLSQVISDTVELAQNNAQNNKADQNNSIHAHKKSKENDIVKPAPDEPSIPQIKKPRTTPKFRYI